MAVTGAANGIAGILRDHHKADGSLILWLFLQLIGNFRETPGQLLGEKNRSTDLKLVRSPFFPPLHVSAFWKF
ncbi:hypothetical protein AP285_19195 [Limnospira platensis YZ]|nr:hypothetical protein AP285_19195 [Arthrospira platensis YZ]KDR56683.1 hypothetical protein APPUASWS_015105 [Arthrospira platensis str. Paraca]